LASFSFDTHKFKSVKHLDTKIRRALFGVCKYWDGPVERYAKVNAPWTDRTGNARAQLAAEATKLSVNRFGIVLSQGVDYGIYLEKSNDENYAIILPTIRVMAPKVIRFCTKLMDRLDRQVGGV
jgi:hypothetical protein